MFNRHEADIRLTRADSRDALKQVLGSDRYRDGIIFSDKGDFSFYDIFTLISKSPPKTPVICLTDSRQESIGTNPQGDSPIHFVASNDFSRLYSLINEQADSQNREESVITQEIPRAFVDSNTDQIFLFDAETLECRYANSAALEYWKICNNQISSISPASFYEEDTFQKLISPLLNGSREKITVCTNIKEDGEFVHPVECRFSLIQNGKKRYISAIHKDRSLAKQQVEKFKNQQQALDKIIKEINEKNDQLADVAHDMRTSFNSILLSNQLLSNQAKEFMPNDLHKYLRAISHSANHLLDYIDEFFPNNESEKQKEIEKERIDAREIGQQLFEMFNAESQRNNISFDFSAKGLESGIIKSNDTYLKRILKNILSNAFTYTDEGSIHFRAYNPGIEELENINFDGDRAVAFSIQDTGDGISEEYQQKIFDRHERGIETDSSPIGQGLGLNISQKLADDIGANLHLESRPGEGSTFTIYLPAHQPENESATPGPKLTFNGVKTDTTKCNKNNSSPQGNILVVDDSEIHNMALQEYLNYSFHQCLTATSKEEALFILQNKSVNCVVLDYMLNATPGLEVARTIRSFSDCEQLPIIIYSGKNFNRQEKKKLSPFINAVIRKEKGGHEKLVHTISACM